MPLDLIAAIGHRSRLEALRPMQMHSAMSLLPSSLEPNSYHYDSDWVTCDMLARSWWNNGNGRFC